MSSIPTPTPTECAEWAAWLTEANTALHAIQIGGKLTRVTHADKTMEFSAGNRGDLLRYIRFLQDRVDACNGYRSRNRVLRFVPD